MTFGGVVDSSGSSGRPGSSGSAGSSGTRGTSGPSGALRSVVGSAGFGSTVTSGSGSGVGSSSEPGIVVLGTVVSGAGSGSGSEVSSVDVVVGVIGSEELGPEDSGSGCADADAGVGVDESTAWVGSRVGSFVGELVAEIEGSAVCLSVEAAAVVSAFAFSEVFFVEAGVFEVGRSDGSAGEDISVGVVVFVGASADAVLSVDVVAWEDEEVAVGASAATWGVGSELEDGVEVALVRDNSGAGAEVGDGSMLLAWAMATATAREIV